MNRAKKTLLIVLINIASIMLVLYGLEFFFSPYGSLPVNGYVQGKYYTWGHLVRNNQYGFRERNFESPKPADVYRIMVLGDSLTWGAGLAVEERYTSIAETLLNSAVSDIKVEVLNFGVSGGPTILEREILGKIGGLVDPDLIVVGFCLNDPQPRSQDYSVERQELSGSTWGTIVHRTSQFMLDIGLPYVGKLVNDGFYRSAEQLNVIPTWQSALQRTYEPSSMEWQVFVRALKDIKSISDHLGLSAPIFSVLNQGTFTDRPTDYTKPDKNLEQFMQWYHQAQRTAESIGFASHNHEAAIAKELGGESLALNILDGHPSANLNEIYGKRLYEKILERIVRHQGESDYVLLNQRSR